MPVTRSQSDAPASRRRADSEKPEDSTATTTTSGTPITDVTGTTSAETSATTGTETTAATMAPSPGKDRQEGTPLATKATKTKTVKTTSSRRRLRELEAEEELARLELQRIEAATKLAQLKLSRVREQASEDSEEDNHDRNAQVSEWLDKSITVGEMPKDKVKPEAPESAGPVVGVKELADALRDAFSGQRAPSTQPQYLYELPAFDGQSSEWQAFHAVYSDTQALFNNTQNTARLRKAVRGNAREAIKSLLYSDAAPMEIIDALRRRYGRPDALVMCELEKIRHIAKINENPKDICTFASQINNSVAAITALKKEIYLHSPETLKCIVDKLPSVMKFRWYDYADAQEGEMSDLRLVARFLNREADRCGAYAAIDDAPRRDKGGAPNRPTPTRQAAHAATATEEKKVNKCPQCGSQHYLYECKEFREQDVQDRWALVVKHRLCFQCFSGRHRYTECKRYRCRVCRGAHHVLLHKERTEAKPDPPADDKAELTTNVTAQVTAASQSRAYLKMIPVELRSRTRSTTVIALLDEGSTVSLLDSEVAAELQAEGEYEELVVETVGGRKLVKGDSQRLDLEIQGVYDKRPQSLKQVRTIDNLKLTPQFIDPSRLDDWKHLKSLKEVLLTDCRKPRLLIGQDNWHLIVSRCIRKGKPGQPVASRTELGWVLHGLDTGATKVVNYVNSCMHIHEHDEDDNMHQLIKRHFAVEALGIEPRRPSNDVDQQALKILQDTCRRRPDGRFEAGMLWRDPEEKMPESYSAAEKRLCSIERKLNKNSTLKKSYSEQINNLLSSGYAEEVVHDTTNDIKTWYLPHFAVTHPQKKKIRLVFDAAARTNGKSLNDALLPGPDLLQSLFGVLVRFRQGPMAVAADIKEMFLQIKIREQDRDSLRFLWRESQETQPKIYRMTSVIFGATSSPSTAIYVKNRNAAEHESEYPDAALAIRRNHYMDDYLQSFHRQVDFLHVPTQVDKVHKKAGFELRGWASNRPALLSPLLKPPEKEEVDLGQAEEKTLGLRWFTNSDQLGFRTTLCKAPDEVLNNKRTPTKREVTSAVMSTFDPLGLATPVLIQGKKVIQSIWRSGVDWDDPIGEEEEQQWVRYLTDLELLTDLHVPRCISPLIDEGELHTFTDASETAYAAAVYWRTKISAGEYATTLIAAKARVTPLKPVSMPRLELQAALLGSRLAHTIEKEMDLRISAKTYWTDSSVVLAWIKSDPRTFKTFVAHRLAEIEDTTTPQQWRWVPTADNPADDATRSLPEGFNSEHRWFIGPAFLQQDESAWPASRTFVRQRTQDDKESAEATAAVKQTPSDIDPERFSSWMRLLRTTARVLQFAARCRRRPPQQATCAAAGDTDWKRRNRKKVRPQSIDRPRQGNQPNYLPIDDHLLRRAEKWLLQRAQHDCFREDIERTRRQQTLERSSRLRRVDITIEDGLLRLRGRVGAVEGATRDYTRPVILDGKHRTARLIIEHYHRIFHHGNHATVMNEIRQRYHVLGLRSALRAIQHGCLWCRMRKGQPRDLPFGDLPPERLRHGAHPFTCTAVDYFGPMTVTSGRRHEKRWGALFTCLTTRAVHLELATALSTDSMILALRRLAARRGMPKSLFSDNGTNFVGANKELRQAVEALKKEDLTTEAEKHGVRWKFIPPGAPHMGGAWERLVRSVKTALAATLHERHPREEVLHTLLLEAEHIINSRPLTDLEENELEEALTPNHFLIGRSCGAGRLGAFSDAELVGRDTWRTTQRLAALGA